MPSWVKPPPLIKFERPTQFVKRESMWDPQKRLVKNKAVMIAPEMDPTIGPMLKDLSGNVIIYDYFIRDGFFYLISIYWSDASPRLQVLVNDEPAKEYGYQEYMSTRYFVSPCQDTGLVWVTINNVQYELMPDIIKKRTHNHKLGIVLNFKYESVAWIRRFLDYYRAQGVDAFYFYYNGYVLPAGLPKGSDIIYRVWDCPFKILNNRFIHSAQTVAYCSFRWRYYDDCDWVAVIDLDEFICDIYEKGRVIDILNKTDCSVVMINNYWGSVGPEGGVIRYSMLSCGFAYDNGRTKCIYNTRKYKGEFAIHLPKGNCMMIKSNRLIFIHIIDCLHPERAAALIQPINTTRTIKVKALL